MDQRSASDRPSEPGRNGGPGLSRIGRLAPVYSPGCRPASFITGGGLVYLLSSHRLTIFHHRSVTNEMQEMTGFPGISGEDVARGEREGLYTKK